MKKIIALILALTMAISLTACANNTTPQDTSTVNVQKGLFDVTVTLPAFQFEGQSIETIKENAQQDGVSDIRQNEDGSVTYQMTKAAHKEMLAGVKETLVGTFKELKTSGSIASLKDITWNDTFSELTLSVDKSLYDETVDPAIIMSAGVLAASYQMFDGVASSKTKVTMNVKDTQTGETIDTIVYPDDSVDKADTTIVEPPSLSE